MHEPPSLRSLLIDVHAVGAGGGDVPALANGGGRLPEDAELARVGPEAEAEAGRVGLQPADLFGDAGKDVRRKPTVGRRESRDGKAAPLYRKVGSVEPAPPRIGRCDCGLVRLAEEQRHDLPAGDVGNRDDGFVRRRIRFASNGHGGRHLRSLQQRPARDGPADAHLQLVGSADGEVEDRHAVEPPVLADAGEDAQWAACVDAHGEGASGYGIKVVEQLGAARGERVFLDVGDIDNGWGRGPRRETPLLGLSHLGAGLAGDVVDGCAGVGHRHGNAGTGEIKVSFIAQVESRRFQCGGADEPRHAAEARPSRRGGQSLEIGASTGECPHKAVVFLDRLWRGVVIPVEGKRIAAGGEREGALRHDRSRRLVQHVAWIGLLLVADTSHQGVRGLPVVRAAPFGLAGDGEALLDHAARFGLGVEARAGSDADGLVRRSRQCREKRAVVRPVVGGVGPDRLIAKAAGTAKLIRRLADGGGVEGERFGVEGRPIGAQGVKVGRAVPAIRVAEKPLRQFRPSPISARLRVECADAATAEAALRFPRAEPEVVVEPVGIRLCGADDRLRETVLVGKDERRARAEESEAIAVGVDAPGVLRERLFARLGGSVVRHAVAEGQPLLVGEADAGLVAKWAERRDLFRSGRRAFRSHSETA